MRRILGRIVHNWPLKLAAVALASLMYGGLALSQNTQTYPGPIPVRFINEPKDTVVLTQPPTVLSVRYFAPVPVQVGPSTFVATIDLSTLEPTGIVSAHIDVTTADSRIRILGADPPLATIELDKLATRNDVPVRVVHGPVPDGLTLDETTVEPSTVTVSGAASILSKVDSVRADVVIQATGIDVDEDVQLVPVDKLGAPLSPLDVTPPSARVTIPVFSDRQSRTLPVNPIITGTPAAGFEIASVTVDPQVVLVGGDADQLAQLTRVDTKPISMTGVSADETFAVDLALPTGIVSVGDDAVRVTVRVRLVTETRTYSAGLRLVGAESTSTYSAAVDRVLVTLGGSTADLNRLSGASLTMNLDVTGLRPGVHDVRVTANLPAGTALVAANPPTVAVTITGPPASASPSGLSPSSSPGGG